MVSYQLEDWETFVQDGQELWQKQNIAVGFPGWEPKPNHPLYEFLDSSGLLQIMTLRLDGELIGYCIMTLQLHSHYVDKVCAMEDSIYVDRDKCSGLTLMVRYRQLLRNTLEALRERSVVRVFFNSRVADRFLPRVLQGFQFQAIDTIYTRELS